MYLDTISRNIRHYRKMQELTQEELAERALRSVTIIRKLESGNYIGGPSLETLELVAAALHLSVTDLIEERPANGASLAWMRKLSAERSRLLHCFNVALDEMEHGRSEE